MKPATLPRLFGPPFGTRLLGRPMLVVKTLVIPTWLSIEPPASLKNEPARARVANGRTLTSASDTGFCHDLALSI